MRVWQIILFVAGLIILSLGLIAQHTSPLWATMGITAGLLSIIIVGYTLRSGKR